MEKVKIKDWPKHVCIVCGKDTKRAKSCIGGLISIGGKDYEHVRYGDEKENFGADNGRCPDCGVVKGGYHHPTCDIERCPKCGEQFSSHNKSDYCA